MSVILGVITWLLLLLLDLTALFSAKNNIAFGLPSFAPKIALGLFVLSIVLFYRYRINKAESVNFIDLLWRVFVTGLITTVVSLAIKFIFSIFGDTSLAKNPLVINFFYHINLGLIIAFTVSTLIVWKRLILYQKTKTLLAFWRIFEYSLLGALAFDILGYALFDPFFNVLLGVLILMGLVLSFNLKWVAYLNFKQKWKSILFIVLVIIYLFYFLDGLVDYSNQDVLVTDLLDSVYILASFSFISIYSLISALVILFNLPTSSVFEKKLEEAMNFQRLSQSQPTGQKKEQIYEILLDSTISAVFADAAWLEITEDSSPILSKYNVTDAEIEDIKEAVKNTTLKKVINTEFDQVPNSQKLSATLKGVKFKSILLFPIIIKQKQIGSIALLKEVGDSFNKEMVDIINTFVNQASISLENFQLINEAIKNERYKEELKIASRVQQSLLPSGLEQSDHFDIHGISVAADEVGGDYYDSFRLDDDRLALIIADVSGKGTSAAFHMSQMKGIFHSLVQMSLDPKQLMVAANNALSRCLEKTSFITATYFEINTSKTKVSFARAGHCPTLYYSAQHNQLEYFKNKGLGLGILRNSNFEKYVQVNEFQYSAGDIIVLYTDGITEAANGDNEQFGYERLSDALMKFTDQTPEQISNGIFETLYEFCEQDSLDDDYSMVVVKFR
ncbi:MAG: SpoIIE family protein phosphatase [Cyclobacteriaceae bacterium]